MKFVWINLALNQIELLILRRTVLPRISSIHGIASTTQARSFDYKSLSQNKNTGNIQGLRSKYFVKSLISNSLFRVPWHGLLITYDLVFWAIFNQNLNNVVKPKDIPWLFLNMDGVGTGVSARLLKQSYHYRVRISNSSELVPCLFRCLSRCELLKVGWPTSSLAPGPQPGWSTSSLAAPLFIEFSHKILHELVPFLCSLFPSLCQARTKCQYVWNT